MLRHNTIHFRQQFVSVVAAAAATAASITDVKAKKIRRPNDEFVAGMEDGINRERNTTTYAARTNKKSIQSIGKR